MTQRPATTKAELLAHIDRTWRDLHDGLAQLTEEQITVPRDPAGWTIKDHLVHLMAWERSCLFLLQGKPRHDGLGVDEAVYLRGVDDEINAVIYAQTKSILLQDVLASYRAVHQTLLSLVARMSDADLQLRYRHYLPDEPGEGDGPPVLNVIHTNTVGHYIEHLPWIQALVTAGK